MLSLFSLLLDPATPAWHKDLLLRYVAGDPVSSLADRYGISVPWASQLARKLGARPRRSFRLPVNHFAFSVVTAASSYWIGLLMADGSVRDRGSVSLALHERDRGHVEAFRDFLCSRHKLHVTPRGMCSVEIASHQMASDLALYGVVPRKSLSAKACGGIEWSRDFWRGAVDGDGSVGYYRRGSGRHPFLTLAGSRSLAEQFSEFVGIHATRKPRVDSIGNIFQVYLQGIRAVEIARVLYDGAETALERKRALAVAMYSP